MYDNHLLIRIAVNEDDYRRIRIAAALQGHSVASFTQAEVLRAADMMTAGIEVPALDDTYSTR